MILNLILLTGGLFLLVKGADVFIDGSSEVAKTLKLSEMLIGITLVCFGTSLPELFLSITGNLEGAHEFVISNIVGTNIFNMCAILGMVSIIKPVKFLRATVRKDMYMSLATAVIFLLVILDTPFTALKENIISRTDGLIFLIFFGVFMYYTIYEFGGFSDLKRRRIEEEQDEISNKKKNKKRKDALSKDAKTEVIKNLLICVIGGIMVYIGSELVINSSEDIAKLLGLSDKLIAIMVVAVGTSLPEIATSALAIKKGVINIAIGNLIGSNMFNMLFVLGLSSTINPITLTTTSLWIDAILFLLVNLFIVSFAKKRFVNSGEYQLARIEGIMLLCTYVIYVVYVVFRG